MVKQRKLVVISGRSRGDKKTRNIQSLLFITQKRLARIQELQSRIEFESYQLSDEWKRVRKEMMEGATVEIGPLRAWLNYSLRYIKKRHSKTRVAQKVTKLIIR